MQNGFLVGDSHQVEPSLNSVTGPAGPIRLEPKVMQVLVLLAAHAGQVVAKERLIHTVWPDTFVTDDVLTRAISELRRVFGDEAKESRFIQTIPKSGYRLIARLSPGAGQEVAGLGQSVHLETVAAGADLVIASVHQTDRASTRDRTWWPWWKLGLWAIGLAAIIVVGVVVVNRLRADAPPRRLTIAVLPFEHLGGPEREYLTDGLTEETSGSLGQIDPEHLSVKGRTATRRYKQTSMSAAEIGKELDVEYLVEGSVQAESGRLRVTSKLIRARDQVQVWAESYDSEPGSLLELQRELSDGNCPTGSTAPLSGATDGPGTSVHAQSRRVRPLPSWPSPLESVDARDEPKRSRSVREGDPTRSRVRTRVGWPGGRLLGQADHERCTSVGGGDQSPARGRERVRLWS